MFSAFEWRVGFRYLRARRRKGFISFISLVSVLGIALGVAALIIVLSVMNGFQKEIRHRILGVASHIELTGAQGKLVGWQALREEVLDHPRVKAAAPFVHAQGLFSAEGQVKGAMIRGIEPALEKTVGEVAQHMRSGSFYALQPGSFGVLLGKTLADELGVNVGDKVTLITPQGQITPAGLLPRLKQFTVVGTFKVDMYEYDAGLAMIHQEDARRLFRMGDAVGGLRLKLEDVLLAPIVMRELASTLKTDAYLSDWTSRHANYFRAVQIEKRMMFIILTLIVAVAAFNLVSTLVMVVTDKQSDIAILRTLGATPKSILGIFVIQGSLSGCLGTFSGVLSGVVVSLNIDVIVPAIERLLGIQILSSEVYLISQLPSDLQMMDVLTVGSVALMLSLLATLYPSWRAARVQPAEALRYE